jgi:hypothetical protein
VTEPSRIQQLLDEVHDQALVFHGYTDYMRDYDLFLYCVADPRTGIVPVNVRYRFTHCVVAEARTALTPENWRRSLDERLLDHDTAADLDGYVWGVKWQGFYPGGRIISESPRASEWSEALGIQMHHVEIETNGHDLTLVFHTLLVEDLPVGFAPFVTGIDGPNAKMPWGAPPPADPQNVGPKDAPK